MAAQPPSSSVSSRRLARMMDKSVGMFNIEYEIGKGSFATVYRGSHKVSQAIVAVKSVNLSRLNLKLKKNLYCEIEILKGLHHPHIVALIDCHESTSYIHLIMEFCELGDLSYIIKERHNLEEDDALKEMVNKYPTPVLGGLNEVIVRHFLKQLASAMKFLREKNYIHRDVKPQNLLILPAPQHLTNNTGRLQMMNSERTSVVPIQSLRTLPLLKLADFGFARTLSQTSLADTSCGSPLYMAPEVLFSQNYDAKADLWSVGTVLYEMMIGTTPFSEAKNNEDLKDLIKKGEIKFPENIAVSSRMKDIIKSLLKRKPVERLAFEAFFTHPVVVEAIPGLVGDDRPNEVSVAMKPEGVPSSPTPQRTDRPLSQIIRQPSSSLRERAVVPASPTRVQAGVSSRGTPQTQPSSRDRKRPTIIPVATAPNPETIQSDFPPSQTFQNHQMGLEKRSAVFRELTDGTRRAEQRRTDDSQLREEAEQDVRDAREYVLVEKRSVEVNAFADELAANPRLQNAKPSLPPRSGAMTRRATTQSVPMSTGGVAPYSRAATMARPRPDTIPQRQRQRQNSLGRSPTSAITKALNNASLRMFGVSWDPNFSKGVSPPQLQLYGAYPAYPAPQAAIGLLGDGKSSKALDEDMKFVAEIEESASRSDVVYGFAEVKWKQLVPLAPSMDHGLGDLAPTRNRGLPYEDEEVLTIEAIISLSEEALVLYVKALSLLARAMDIAGAWWARKCRCEVLAGHHAIPRAEYSGSTLAGTRINHAVQWVRGRFNEVLEKAELVRLKLFDAQKKLGEEHPGHPLNDSHASKSVNGGVILSSGVTAEKLMYDRALEMSRTAAISEIANEDLEGCQLSYVTAIRMLEAVLESDDAPPVTSQRIRDMPKEVANEKHEDVVNGINLADRQAVMKVVMMLKSRHSALRKKMAIIAKHAQASSPSSPRPPSITANYSGRTTPNIVHISPR